MHQDFEIIAPGGPAEVLDRLARYGKDWRESKIPPALSAEGVFGCTITVTGTAFELRLAFDPLRTRWFLRRSGWYRGRGTVEVGSTDGSSRIRVHVERAPAARVLVTSWIVLWVGGWLLINGPLGIGDVAFLGMILGGGLAVFVVDRRAHARLMSRVLQSALADAPPMPHTA